MQPTAAPAHRLQALMETLWKRVPGKIYNPRRDLGRLFVPQNIRRPIMLLEWEDVSKMASDHELPCTLVNGPENKSFSFLVLDPGTASAKLRILLGLERTHFQLDPPPEGEKGDWIHTAHEFVLSSPNQHLLTKHGIPQVPVILERPQL